MQTEVRLIKSTYSAESLAENRLSLHLPSHLVKKFSSFQQVRHRQFRLCSRQSIAHRRERLRSEAGDRRSALHEGYTFARVRSAARAFVSTDLPRPLLRPVTYSHHSIIGLATAIEE